MTQKKISLRKKIVLLAMIPALTACVIFAFLVWSSSRRASSMVRENVTDFMMERTLRSLAHGRASATVASSYMNDLLRLHMKMATVVLNRGGGASLTGAQVAHVLPPDGEHVAGKVMLSPMRFAGETVVVGRSERLQEIAQDTGTLAILFERVNATADLVRISASSPKVTLGSFLSSTVEDEESPADKIVRGEAVVARTLEGGVWHRGRYEPLRDSRGQVIGALYLGLPVDAAKTLVEELGANAVGAHGSVVLIRAHGPERGKMILTPSGIAERTQKEWLPKVMQSSLIMKNAQEEAVNIFSPADKADAIVRYTYLQQFDWILIAIADSRDLQGASAAVKNEFHDLLYRSLAGASIVLIMVLLVSTVISKRLVDPLLEITIQLTSNGTQVASSAKQQLSHATSFNTSSTEIAATVKEISATSQELLKAMEELSQEAEHASTAAQEGSSGLRGLSQSIEALSKATTTISESLREIRSKASKINTVTLAVTKVADQTNLLSLNAAIEAEKAGEAGSGFAVVAREIRRLADQSANSSQEIEQTIHEMQDAVTAGVEEVEALTSVVAQSVSVSDRIHEQFTEIIARVEAMAPRYQIVHLGMQNQSEGAQQISEAMWQLKDSAGQTSEAIAELNQVSLQLHQAVGILKQRVFQGEGEQPSVRGLHGVHTD